MHVLGISLHLLYLFLKAEESKCKDFLLEKRKNSYGCLYVTYLSQNFFLTSAFIFRLTKKFVGIYIVASERGWIKGTIDVPVRNKANVSTYV